MYMEHMEHIELACAKCKEPLASHVRMDKACAKCKKPLASHARMELVWCGHVSYKEMKKRIRDKIKAEAKKAEA